jgi:hypothetical protein
MHHLALPGARLRSICLLEAEEYNPHGRGLGYCTWSVRLKPEIESWCAENLSGAVEVRIRPGSAEWDLVFEHEHERTWFKLVWY